MLLVYAWAYLALALVLFALWDKFKKRSFHEDKSMLLSGINNVHPVLDIKIHRSSGGEVREESAPGISTNGGHKSLSSLKTGESAVVRELSGELRGPVRRRLLDLGIVPGTKIKAVVASLGGDPTAFLVRGTLIALRKDQTNHIYIEDYHNEDGN